MSNIFKEIKWNLIITSLLLIVTGVFLFIYPDTSATILCDIVGGIVILYGIINVVRYILTDIKVSVYRNDFILGVMSLCLGLFIIIKSSFFVSIIPMIFGFIIILSGLSKLQDGIDAKRLGYAQGITYIILSLISICFGAVILFNPFSTAEILFMIIGIGLIYSGCSDLFSTLYLSNSITHFKKRYEQPPVMDADVIEEREEDL